MRVQKVYIELIFLENFIVDLLIIFFAALLTGSKIRIGKFSSAAAVGALYACIAAIQGGICFSVITKAAVSAAMCFIAFWGKYEKGFFKNSLAFYVSTFILAGTAYAVTFCFSHGAKPSEGYVLLGLCAGAAFIGIFSRVRKSTIRRERATEQIVLEYRGKKVTLKAFIDTGNMLTEPLSGLDVIPVSRPEAKALLGKDIDLTDGCPGERTERLRAVPYATAAGEGVMLGIEIDKISLKGKKEGIRAVVCPMDRPLAGGCGALAGGALMDKLMEGAGYDKVAYRKGSCMDTGAPESCVGSRLYKRNGCASTAPYSGGGERTAGDAGEGGEVCKADPD